MDAVRRPHPAGGDAVDLAGDHRGRRAGWIERFQYLWRIVLPLLTPIIVVVGLIRLIDALKTFDLIYIITRGGPGTATYTLPLHAYATGFESFLMGPSAAIAWVVVIIVNVFASIFLWLLAREQA